MKEFGEIYGEDKMTMNIHLLLHLCKQVRMCGPLWAQSAFFFESHNGELAKCIKGPTDVLPQIVKKYILRQRHTITKTKRLGAQFLHEVEGSSQKIEHIRQQFNLTTNDLLFKCFKVGNTKYTSLTYERAHRTCNCFIELVDGTFGRVMCFLKKNNKGYLIVESYATHAIIDHLYDVGSTGEFYMHEVQNIRLKLMYLKPIFHNKKEYLVAAPNTLEIF